MSDAVSMRISNLEARVRNLESVLLRPRSEWKEEQHRRLERWLSVTSPLPRGLSCDIVAWWFLDVCGYAADYKDPANWDRLLDSRLRVRGLGKGKRAMLGEWIKRTFAKKFEIGE